MVAEALAGLSALKTAFDLAKGLKDINDATIRNGAIIELQERILAARQHQDSLLNRISALEAEVTRFEEWDAEKQRYEPKNIGGGAVAYMLKPAARGSEPPHWLCPNWYAQSKKAFYQPTGAEHGRSKIYRCQGCEGVLSNDNQPEWLYNVQTTNGKPPARMKAGEQCPKCGEMELRVERSEPHPTFGRLGGTNRHMKCDGCGFTEVRLIKPK